MSSDEIKLVGKLRHQINSPLAVIRNALYLASAHSVNVKVTHYLKLADQEVSRIAGILKHSTDESSELGSALT
jgi:hypothetical protein